MKLLFGLVGAALMLGFLGSVVAKVPEISLIIVVAMFAGRLGPLTLALAVRPSAARGKFEYAEESMIVG